jgi:hypothetical protein
VCLGVHYFFVGLGGWLVFWFGLGFGLLFGCASCYKLRLLRSGTFAFGCGERGGSG